MFHLLFCKCLIFSLVPSILSLHEKKPSKLILPHQHVKPFMLTWYAVSVTGRKLNIGFITRAKLNRLLDEGDITPQQVDSFDEAVLCFLTSAVDYALKKLPLKEPLLKHSTFVDVRQRAESDIRDVLYFVERFPHLIPYHGPEEHDLLGEEFLSYQTMPMISLQDETEMESFWAEMATRKHKVWLGCVAIKLSHAYIVMHFANFACFYLNCVNGSTYSILTVLINK
ncbi:hypothetical protein N1851_008530 [Merluccius polli]|uniref:Uncharacterized protein n=1 Tax=Merluccius polli TaxID=89951 RepID=A0AA47N0Z6_MERPO|nr:hypothetical protein N1851_008530 [Merluccius polli]